MSEYAKKTCYDCGVRKPAPYMERVTESYTSGQSNTKVTAGNLVFGALGDKRGQNAVGRAIKGNNRRQYTRNRTVWKCMDCSGTNDYHRSEVRKDIKKATKAIASAQKGGIFSAPKNLPSAVHNKMHALKELDGTTGSKTSEDLFKEIKTLIKNAPDAAPSKVDAAVAPVVVKDDAAFDAKIQQTWAERRQLSPTEVKIINFVLTMFAVMCYGLAGIGILGAVLEPSNAVTGIVLAAIGFGGAMLFNKFKR